MKELIKNIISIINKIKRSQNQLTTKLISLQIEMKKNQKSNPDASKSSLQQN